MVSDVPQWDYYIRMNIIALAPLKDFWTVHPDSEQPLRAWVDEVKKADWQTPADIKAQYGTASILKNSCFVFNIKGNDYLLIISVAYAHKRLFAEFIGTHKEYDRIDANTVILEP